MERICALELLDRLPPEDEGAIGSRRDLRRLNWWMGNARIMAGALNRFVPANSSLDILEIGSGDGDFLAKVLRGQGCPRSNSKHSERKTATLLDRQDLLAKATKAQIRAAGWETRTIKCDVFEWFNSTTEHFDAVLANLFLHHFTDQELASLFKAIAPRAELFIAVEPRRANVSIFTEIFFWAIGCNSVTRHDAKVSIRAGFDGRELTALWPNASDWTCEEHSSGFSSHLFIARKNDSARAVSRPVSHP